jgi:hypothetical protein
MVMEITNKYDLPEAIIRAISVYNYAPEEGRYSVTDLVNPPRMRLLKIRHWRELSVDASERLWALFGQACHKVLDMAAPPGSTVEGKLIVDFEGVRLVGKSDLYHQERVEDYKVTSVYSFLLEDGKTKKEWEEQLNVYAWLFSRLGKPVKELWVRAILRDWQNSKALQDMSYPRIPFQSVQVPLWPTPGQERYIRARLEAHRIENPQCSDEERWLRPSSWAVMKKNNQKAYRVFDNPWQAENLAKTDKAFVVVERKGSYNRCENYCPVRAVCSQAKGTKVVNLKERG